MFEFVMIGTHGRLRSKSYIEGKTIVKYIRNYQVDICQKQTHALRLY